MTEGNGYDVLKGHTHRYLRTMTAYTLCIDVIQRHLRGKTIKNTVRTTLTSHLLVVDLRAYPTGPQISCLHSSVHWCKLQ